MFLVVLVGAPSLKCLSSERWSDLVPSCDKIECPDISTVVKVNNGIFKLLRGPGIDSKE
jgi:hypothetical protein